MDDGRVGGFQSGFHARAVERSACRFPEYLICSHDCERVIQLVSHVSGEVELELCAIEAARMARLLVESAEQLPAESDRLRRRVGPAHPEPVEGSP